ncbi:MAG: aldehyde dehydrogenase family protein, partial [Candidatus Puniceispirillales bacterium]
MSLHSYGEWQTLAGKLKPRQQLFINGRFEDAASGKCFSSINPATNAVIAEVAEGDATDIDRAVTAARAAFNKGVWSEETPQNRKSVLLKLAELIRANLEELALLDSMDMGKLVEDAAAVDVPGSAAFFQWYAEAIDKI